MRVRRAVTVAITLGTGITLLAVVLPGVRFAYRLPRLHVALETAEGLIALLLAYLAYGRFRLARRASDYILTQALAIFATTNVVVSAVPRAAFGGHGQELSAWAAVVLRLIGGAAFAAAAWAPHRPLRRRYGVRALLATTAAAVGAAIALVLLIGDGLPAGVDPAAVGAARAHLDEPLLIAVQFVSASLFSGAAYGFFRRTRSSTDELTIWLCVAAVASAFARINYGLFPSLYSGWVYTGDFLRLTFYALLLTGAAREIRLYWDSVTATAMLDERRRVARDLHDGLAQELAFLATQSTRLARGADVDPETLSHTARRALDESRRAIAALTTSVDEPVERVLADAVGDVARRGGAAVRMQLDAVGKVDAGVREQLVRVVREAATNAILHGHPTVLTLTLRRDGTRLRLEVADDGAGFDVESVPRGGFGLVSMRERVEALGGRLTVRSEPGAGTVVEAEVEAL